ncbi:MAG: hypothetical protein Q9169_006929 [Polycauliona sp. 2 TL-2023]
MGRMLKYLYTGDYDDTDDEDPHGPQAQQPSSGTPPVQTSIDQREQDDKNEPNAIDEAGKPPVHVKISSLVNNVLVYALGDKLGLFSLLNLAQTNSKFARQTNDQGLRQSILQVSMRYIDQLMVDPKFRETLLEDAQLSFDILTGSHKKYTEAMADSWRSQHASMRGIKYMTATQQQLLALGQLRNANARCAFKQST